MKTLFLTSFIMISFNAFSETADDACNLKFNSPGKIADKFCECAPRYLNSLSPKIDQEKLNKLKELSSKRVLLNDSKKLIGNYLSNINDLSKKLESSSQINERLNKYNQTIQQAYFIKGLQSIVSNKKELGSKFDLGDYCAKEASVAKDFESICQYQKKVLADNKISRFFSNSTFFSKTFNSMVEIYQNSSPNSSDIDSKINKLLSTIPESVSPDAILATTSKIKDGINTRLKAANNSDLNECFSDNYKENQCLKVLKSLDKNGNQAIVENLNSFPKTNIDEKILFEKKIDDVIEKKINAAYLNLNSFNEKDKESRTQFNTLNNSINYKEIEAIESKLGNNFKFGFDNYKSTCSDLTLDNPIKLSEKVSECKNILENISKKLTSDELNKMDQEINKLNSEVFSVYKNAISSNQKSMMSYVANKYNRECKNKKNLPLSKIELSTCNNGVEEGLSALKIGEDFYPIIGKINEAYNLDSSFGKQEMNEYSKACLKPETEVEKTICMNISKDTKKYRNTKSTEEILAYREKYTVDYDQNGNVRSVTEKKSNAAIIGQAFLPAIPTLIQGAIMNDMASFNISMMQQQAMYQKQWMWDYNKANNLWYSNMFYSPFSTTTGTISQSTYNQYGFKF